jgi:acylphosphatase
MAKNALHPAGRYGLMLCVTGRREDFPSGTRPDVAHWARENAVNRRRMQILYSGNVQGVGFRYTVKSVAAGYEVTGQVRNLPDGRVELVAEGDLEELRGFSQAVRDSGLEHFIAKEQATWGAAQGEFHGFEIAR